MQFRERRRVIQVIRTTYDPELKRGRSEVVGKIDRAAPTLSDKLQKNCTPDELAEVQAWLEARAADQRQAAVRAGAETLPAQMRAAAEYFRGHGGGDGGEEAASFAAEIRDAWEELRTALRKAGLHKPPAMRGAQG